MKVVYLTAVLSSLSLGLAQEGSRSVISNVRQSTSMSRSELKAFDAVAEFCYDDVTRLCDKNRDHADTFMSNHMRGLTSSSPSVHVPNYSLSYSISSPLHDIEHIFDSLMSLPVFTEPTYFILFDQDPSYEDQVWHHVVTEIAGKTSPQDIPAVHEKLVHRGMTFLQDDEIRPSATAMQRRMARRLTEISPQVFMQHRSSFLPFGATRNDCLQSAYEQKFVSASCKGALAQLEKIRADQFQAEKEEMGMFTEVSILYIFAMATFAVLIVRYKRDAVSKEILKARIVQAIYSRPSIKAAVEKELDEPLGHVPPLHRRFLRMIGTSSAQFRYILRASRRLRFSLYVVSFVLIFIAPQVFVSMAMLVAALAFFFVLCSPKPVQMCTCCCCGASTDDAKKGQLSDAQQCCSCCQGTGVCCVACASCCNKTRERTTAGCTSGCYKTSIVDDSEAAWTNGYGSCCCGAECCQNGCCGGTGGCCCTPQTVKMEAQMARTMASDCCCCGADCCKDGCCGGAGGCCCSTPEKKFTAGGCSCCGAACCKDGCCGGAGGCCCSTPEKKSVADGCCCCGAACCKDGCCGGSGGCCCSNSKPDDVFMGVPIQIV